MRTLCCVLLVFVGAYAHKTHKSHNGHERGQETEPDQPEVESPSGVFRGGYNVTRRGRKIETYRGIHYAEPPIGNLRFQPPVPILKYIRPVDATQDGPACPQPTEPDYYVAEDCLTVNVYTPHIKNGSQLLPVIFYIHAGGYYSVSGRSDFAGPHYLLDRDIVLVTINYRLGSLGFLSTGDRLAPGNNGLKDQVAALKWVQRNIAAFGGDPNSVTITGCSVGSMSVMLHMISPMSKGLFHRGISMSGSPIFAFPSPDNLYSLAEKQARLLNCPTNNSEVIVDCLKSTYWRDFGDSLEGFSEFAYDPIMIWWPVVEKDYGQERFLTMEPLDAIRQGKMHAVPHIISQTTDEFFWKAFTVLENKTLTDQMNAEWEKIAPISFIMPRENPSRATQKLFSEYLNNQPLKNDTESAKKLGWLYADGVESFPVHRMANLMCRHSPHPVWYYEFSYIGTNSHYRDPVTNKPIGAAHHDDLIYLFSLSAFPDIGTKGRDALLVDRMTAIWYNFAKYGDPNPNGGLPELEGLKWPAMKSDDRKYLRISDDLTVHSNLKEERIKVWDELYPIQY